MVSLEQAVAAPFASRQLADLGARVIKVERPGTGDFARDYDTTVRGMSSHFVWLNRSKESVAINLKSTEGLESVMDLVASADVFIQNFSPGATERLGLGVDEMMRLNPRLIICNISGYGEDGPLRDEKAYDLLIQAEVGLISITGSEAEPAKTGIPSADISAGMYAFSGILAALVRRNRTGKGAVLDISLFDSLVEWMGYPLYYADYGGHSPVRAGTSHAAIAPYGIFRVGDGAEFVISIQNQREWESFCAVVLEQPELAADSRFNSVSKRVTNRVALNETIDASFSDLSGPVVESLLRGASIAFARYRNLDQVLIHPQLVERNRWASVESPVGPLNAVLPPIGIRGSEPRMGPIPFVGEHTVQVLAEFRGTAARVNAAQSSQP